MINMVSKFHSTFIFLLLASGIIIANLAAATTNDGQCTTLIIGPCGNPGYCDRSCKIMVTDGVGSCDASGQCNCVYSCMPSPTPPAPKRCNSNNGLCYFGCDENCCKEKCNNKWPGASADGSCEQLGPYPALCLCTFDCPKI